MMNRLREDPETDPGQVEITMVEETRTFKEVDGMIYGTAMVQAYLQVGREIQETMVVPVHQMVMII